LAGNPILFRSEKKKGRRERKANSGRDKAPPKGKTRVTVPVPGGQN